MSDNIIKPPTLSDNSLAPVLSYNSNKTRVNVDESCLEQDKITFTYEEIVNIYIMYEIRFSTCGCDDYPVLEKYLLGAA